MTTTRRGAGTRPEPAARERQAWRLPQQLVEFLKREAKEHGNDVTQFATRIFRAFGDYDLPRSSIVALEADREALRMRRWDYYVHAFDRRARMIGQHGPGFDAAGTVRPPKGGGRGARDVVVIDRWTTGVKVLLSWYLPPDLRQFLRDEAEGMGWDLTPFAIALLNAYASFHPLPTARAEPLERDRLACGLDRWEYFRHVWVRREDMLIEKGPGFDAPPESRGSR
jgi:hypothetical protein